MSSMWTRAACAAALVTLPMTVHAARRPHRSEPRTQAAAAEGGQQIYPWLDGHAYPLAASPGLVSDILLQPGERLVSVAAGDTLRWIVGETSSGSGERKRTHVLVKPTAAGLRTNLVITTDRRTYLVRLESRPAAEAAVLSWTYAEDALLALERRREAAAAEVAVAVPIDGLNFDYRIGGDKPDWRPLRAFDDGTHVYIEFPPSHGSPDAPPLFIIGDAGKAELVNYRVSGRYYVVDQLFSSAELRMGGKHQTIVTIRRARPHHGWPW